MKLFDRVLKNDICGKLLNEHQQSELETST